MTNLPDSNQKEWKMIISSQNNYIIKSYILQVKVTQLKDLLNNGELSMDDAIKDLHNHCIRFKNTPGLLEDLDIIFNKKESNIKNVGLKNDLDIINYEAVKSFEEKIDLAITQKKEANHYSTDKNTDKESSDLFKNEQPKYLNSVKDIYSNHDTKKVAKNKKKDTFFEKLSDFFWEH